MHRKIMKPPPGMVVDHINRNGLDNGETIYVGLFDDEVEAAKARDRKVYDLAGEFAYLKGCTDMTGCSGE